MQEHDIMWTCHVCGELRPDAYISVFKRDMSGGKLPPGTLTYNIRYCNDRPKCIEGASRVNFGKRRVA